MTRRERAAEAVLLALRTRGPQDVDGLARLTGLTHTAVSHAIYFVRNNHPEYITVPEAPPWMYAIAPTVQAMVPGWLNQRQHDLTRMRSEVTRCEHGLRLAKTAAEVAVLTAALAQAQAAVSSLEAEIALLRML